jgi:hypothetical protein
MLKRIAQIQLKFILQVVLFSPFVLLTLNNIYAYYAQFLRISGFPHAQRSPVKPTPKLALIHALENLQNLSLTEKRKSLLFIPQSNHLYWQWLQANQHYPVCKFIPFIAPSLTGISLLDGLPARNCSAVYGYGFEIYPPRNNRYPLSKYDPPQLCRQAVLKGFSQVIVIDADSDNQITVNKINCGH